MLARRACDTKWSFRNRGIYRVRALGFTRHDASLILKLPPANHAPNAFSPSRILLIRNRLVPVSLSS
jgi:hypothetical protein